MNVTNIEWSTFSSNPLKYRDKATGKSVWACVKTSPGCANCYSEALAERYGRGGPFTNARMATVEPYLCEKELRHMLTAETVGGVKVSGAKCFVGDMTDVAGEWVPDWMLDRLFAAFALRPDVTFQVLTKRADRLVRYFAGLQAAADDHAPNTVSGKFTPAQVLNIRMLAASPMPGGVFGEAVPAETPWPLPNVWVGVSVENKAHGLPRIDLLRRVPAAVRFLSVEPLLEDLGRIDLTGIHWCVVGGESGSGARRCELKWIRSALRQCEAAGVAAFVKQLGTAATDETNGVAGAGLKVPAEAAGLVSLRLRDRKGGDFDEFPAALRVRQWPGAVGT